VSNRAWHLRQEESINAVSHVARSITEANLNEHRAWVKEQCHGKRYYLPQERQRADPVASRARKTIASRFYLCWIGKARPGPFLAMAGQAADDKCWWCSPAGPSQTREHLFKPYRQWKDQRVTMWRAIGMATDGERRAGTARWRSCLETSDAQRTFWSSWQLLDCILPL
jgi:hypothetical protein